MHDRYNSGLAMDVDVAALFDALRTEVRARRQVSGGAESEQSALERQLEHCAEQLEITRVVSAHWPLSGRTPLERGWVLIHKVVRRYLRWYINPIVEQQNAFNDVATRTLRLLIEAHAELRAQAAAPNNNDTSAPTSNAPLPVDVPPDTATLQALVEGQMHNEPPTSLSDLRLLALPRMLNERQTVRAHWEITGATSLQRGSALTKRLVRQYLRWMINPIVEQQNACNAALTEAVTPLIAADAETRGLLARVRHRAKPR